MKAKFAILATVLMLLGSFVLARGMGDSEDATQVAAATVTTNPPPFAAAVQEIRAQEKHDERVRILEAAEAEKQRVAAEQAAARARAAREAARKAQEAREAELRASRAAAARSAQPAATSTLDDAFWKRLSNCESPSGAVGKHIGYFQFSHDTAAKVGIDGSESYEVQKSAAIRWLGMIGGRGGSKSGWPTCWWVALKK